MNSIKVRDLVIGSGTPKICIPIVGRTEGEIMSLASQMQASAADLVEWRADWFEAVSDAAAVCQLLGKMRELLGNLPLLMTFRTKREGGEREISPDEYVLLYEKAMETGCVDMIDAELFMGEAVLGKLIRMAHERGVRLVASNHDFNKTPDKAEMIRRLRMMDDAGADILKIAVMPRDASDVLDLLDVTRMMNEGLTDKPLITMSMGQLGMITRIAGETFGSAVTFGSMGQASAPGQINAAKLKEILTIMKKADEIND